MKISTQGDRRLLATALLNWWICPWNLPESFNTRNAWARASSRHDDAHCRAVADWDLPL